jgi:hypothetical protein
MNKLGTPASDSAGPRRACKALRPAGGLLAALRPFATCLKSHGVTLPGPSQAPSAGGLSQQLLEFASKLRSGSPSYRSAYNACKSKL